VAVLVDDRRQSSVAWIAAAVCSGLLDDFAVWAAELDGFAVWAGALGDFEAWAGAQAGFVAPDGSEVLVGFAVLWPVDWAGAALGGYHSAAWSVA
jgi:hypothetical protein